MKLNLEAEKNKSLDICLKESVGEQKIIDYQRIEGTGHWTDKEHQKFLDALDVYGKNWKLIQQHVGSRSVAQTRSHAQKYFNKLKGDDKGASKQRLVAHRSRRESKEIREEKPKKEKTRKKLQYANNPNPKHERKDYPSNKVVADENNTNKNYEFLEESKHTPTEMQDPLDFSFASFPQTPLLRCSEYECDLCVTMPWDNEIEINNFYSHLNEPLLLEDEVEAISRREEAYCDIITVCKLEKDSNTLFEY